MLAKLNGETTRALDLFDARGQVLKTSASAHHGADLADRALRSWAPPLYSADGALLPELGTLQARNQDLARNNSIASGARQTLLDNIVGTGPRPRCTPDWRALGRDPEWAREWAAQAEALWATYATTTAIDIERHHDFAGLTTYIFGGVFDSGCVGVVPLYKPDRPGVRWGTCFRVIDGARICNPDERPDDERTRGGVEIDADGAPAAYHVRRAHPGDWFNLRNTGLDCTWQRIPAWTPWGRRRFMHIYARDRIGQVTGRPYMAPVMRQLKMQEHFSRTELQSAIAAAMIAAFIRTPVPPEDVLDILSPGTADGRTLDQVAQDRAAGRAPLSPAAILHLNPGEEVQAFNPNRPGGSYEPYMLSLLREIAAGTGLSYERLLRDFSRTNYSSARAALLEDWRYFQGRRAWLALLWCNEAWALLVEEWINAGAIEAPDFYANQQAYCRVGWTWPGRGWIDPLKEANAAKQRIGAGLSTQDAECAEQGQDGDAVREQRIREVDQELTAAAKLALKHRLPTAQVLALMHGDHKTGVAKAAPGTDA